LIGPKEGIKAVKMMCCLQELVEGLVVDALSMHSSGSSGGLGRDHMMTGYASLEEKLPQPLVPDLTKARSRYKNGGE
jgi:hypothetical protein